MKRLFNAIINGLDDAFYIWRKEMKTIVTDQGILMFVFFLCIFYPLIYTFIYNNERVSEVPVTVVDMDRSSLSREFIRKMDASPDVSVYSHSTNMEEARELLKQRKVFGIVYLPSDFSAQPMRNSKSVVSVFCDMSGMLNYSAIYGTCSSVSLELNREIRIAKMGNSTNRQDEIGTRPIDYYEGNIFNPQKGVATYLIPAVLVLILQQSMILGICLAGGTDRENNRFRELVPIQRQYQGTLRILLGKSVAYLTIYILLSAYVLLLVPHWFGLIQIGQFGTIAIFILPFLLASIFFALSLSVFAPSREASMLIFVFSSVPLLFISGISWPGASIPSFWKMVSWLFPSTFGINGFVRINNMGATLTQVLPEWRALWMQTGVYMLTSFFVYRFLILVSRKRFLKRKHELMQKMMHRKKMNPEGSSKGV